MKKKAYAVVLLLILGGIIMYERVNWQNSPSTATPVSADNLNKMDMGIADIDSQLADIASKGNLIENVKSYGAKGDGSTDDTVAIQTAFDTAIGTLFFPAGTYKTTSQLNLKRVLNIVGASSNRSRIVGVELPVDQDIIKVTFDYNYGMQDVRGWIFSNIQLLQSGGGRHGLAIIGGFSTYTSEISRNSLNGNSANNGYGLYVENNLGHSLIELNTLTTAYFKCWDANDIHKNTFIGTKMAITLDLINGVRNNVIEDNTLINRDGAVHIINGDNVRIINNQIELAPGQGVSQSPHKAMIWVEGKDRTCKNTIIEDNNFGGGSSLDYSMYIDNAQKTVIAKNYLIAPALADIYFTAKSRNNDVKDDNFVIGTTANPREDTKFSALIVDNGYGNTGVHKTPVLENSWKGGKFLKDEKGLILFTSPLKDGVIAADTNVLKLPPGFRPPTKSNVPVLTDAGYEMLYHTFNGQLKVKNITSNKNVQVLPFMTNQNTSTDNELLVYDDFDRANSNSLGNAETGQAWVTNSNNLGIANGEVKLNTTTPDRDFAVIDAGVSDCIVSSKHSVISAGYGLGSKLIFRYVDSNNYLYVASFAGAGVPYVINKIVGGVGTVVTNVYGSAYANGDVLKLILNGENIELYINNVKRASATVADFKTATKHGLSIIGTANRIDDFRVYQL